MKITFFILMFSLMLIGCSKDDEDENDTCFNKELVHDDPCTQDCPGFEGCDGKTYCNQCEAARLGIGPK